MMAGVPPPRPSGPPHGGGGPSGQPVPGEGTIHLPHLPNLGAGLATIGRWLEVAGGGAVMIAGLVTLIVSATGGKPPTIQILPEGVRARRGALRLERSAAIQSEAREEARSRVETSGAGRVSTVSRREGARRREQDATMEQERSESRTEQQRANLEALRARRRGAAA